jgi:hypothetical protein
MTHLTMPVTAKLRERVRMQLVSVAASMVLNKTFAANATSVPIRPIWGVRRSRKGILLKGSSPSMYMMKNGVLRINRITMARLEMPARFQGYTEVVNLSHLDGDQLQRINDAVDIFPQKA